MTAWQQSLDTMGSSGNNIIIKPCFLVLGYCNQVYILIIDIQTSEEENSRDGTVFILVVKVVGGF